MEYHAGIDVSLRDRTKGSGAIPVVEPPRDYRRPFGLSYAAMETSSSMA